MVLFAAAYEYSRFLVRARVVKNACLCQVLMRLSQLGTLSEVPYWPALPFGKGLTCPQYTHFCHILGLLQLPGLPPYGASVRQDSGVIQIALP